MDTARSNTETISKMSRATKLQINSTRRHLLLNFLSNEYWTTADNVKLLFNVNYITYVRRFLDSLIKDKLLKKDFYIINGIKKNIYRITDTGLLHADFFEKGKKPKFSVQNFLHNEKVQQLRIIASQYGYEWINEIQAIRSEINFISYPDGILHKDKLKYSIELQRNIYSADGFRNKIAKCLGDVYAGRFDSILFICCDNINAKRLKNAFDRVDRVKGKNHKDVMLNAEYKSKFMFIDFSEFTSFLKNNNCF
jgi:hypothetical protein